jgi:hypothetical protein
LAWARLQICLTVDARKPYRANTSPAASISLALVSSLFVELSGTSKLHKKRVHKFKTTVPNLRFIQVFHRRINLSITFFYRNALPIKRLRGYRRKKPFAEAGR